MADLNANINVGIETTQALNQLKSLQKQISQFHQSVAKSSAQAAVAQRDLQRNFLNGVNAIQGFSAELKTVRTTAESFTNSLEKNKFSMREYFRYSAGATKTFGKNFAAEMSTIERTAIERVKTLQTQYVKMGRDASGAMQAIAVRPTVLDMKDLGTQTAIAAQKQVIFNQLVKQGSTNLLNFGKNTQWAGRQLMVGFTLPLATLGMTAGRVFFDMEKAAIKFKKVYGDLFTAPAETQKAMDSIVELGEAYSAYGVAVSESLSVAADAAAAGFAGVDLQNQTAAALKLSVLGQLELQKALETTISLQNAFQLSSTDLAGEIDFLNAVENQTVVALDDMTEAIPRVAPVIKQLGGDVRDLAFFLAAMKEGGINAAQGANALKSGLASLINPTERASLMLSGLGINIRSIINENQGDIAGTVYAFAKSLDTLDPLKRAQAIEQLFGKFQFARISALFDNITRDGTQAQRVLELAGSTAEELASLSETELATSAASSMNKFRSAVEKLKVALVPVGELFVEIATPFVEFGTRVLDAFNALPGGIKTVIGSVITILGGIGPVLLMTFGLINNGIANMIKFFATVRLGYLKITGQAKGVGDETQYMTQEQLEAAAAAASLDQAHAGLTQRFTSEKSAVDALRVAYQQAADAGARFALLNPGMMKPGRGSQAQGFANGGIVTGPGNGTSDSIPALLSNGEAVIPAKQAKQYAPLIQGMIAGNLPGFAKGVMLGMPRSAKSVSKNREAADAIYEQFLKSSYANTPPTEYGHQISPTSGHSFPIFGLGGVYQKGDKRVFVKPVMDETAALAEIRGTQITRQAHGLEAPEQRIVVIRDPMDPTRQRRFLALESDLDAKFIQNEPKAIFNDEQYFRQLVASLLRVDKDLAAGNVFGNVVADVGPAGVFDRASGIRALKTDLPSMEEQAMINLLGIKGGAKRAFAESTLSLMAGLTPQQYHQRMIGEIQRALPALKKTVADFKLSNPTEAKAYDAMIKRLEAGLGVDWSKFHSVHSNVKIATPKKPKAVAGYANGVVSVPGPKGKGDTVPAMLSPGEAVIPTAMAKKYAPLIQSMIAGNIPGYKAGFSSQAGQFGQDGEYSAQASHFGMFSPSEMAKTLDDLKTELDGFVVDVFTLGEQLEDGTRQVTKSTELLTNFANKDADLLSGGRTYSGTTTIEQKDRNQAYNAAGISGAAFTLEDLSKNGKLAADALASGSTASKKYASQLNDIVAEGQVAEQTLKSSNSLEKRLSFMKENTIKALTESNLSQSKFKTVQEARTAALQTLATVEKQILNLSISGMDEEEMLQEAKRKLAATLVKSGTGEFSIGPRGTGGGELRDVATGRGRSTLRRVFGENEDPNSRKFSSGGRSTAAVSSALYTELRQEGFTAVESALKVVGSAAMSAIRKGLGITSPSAEFENVSNNIAAGIREAGPEAKRAGEVLGETVVTSAATQGTSASGPRRFSTDPLVMAALAGQSQSGATPGSRSGKGRAVRQADMGVIAAPLMSKTAYGPQEDPKNRSERMTLAVEKQMQRMNSLNSSISTAAISLSAVTGVLTMFGGEMSQVTGTISMLTGALFGVMQISQMITSSQGMISLLKIGKEAGGFMEIFRNARGLSTGMQGFARGLSGINGAFKTAFPTFSKLIPVIGLAVTAFAAFQVLSSVIEKQKEKVEGLGNVATLTSEKISKLGEAFNVKPLETFLEKASNLQNPATGQLKSQSQMSLNEQALGIVSEDYMNEISAIKEAGQKEAELVLKSLAIKLTGKGFAKEQVSAIVNAIASEAGRTDVKIDMGSIDLGDISSREILNAQIQQQMNAISQAYKNSYEKSYQENASWFDQMSRKFNDEWVVPILGQGALDGELNTKISTLSSSFQSLFIGLAGRLQSGIINAEQFTSQFGFLSQQIQSMSKPEALLLLDEVVKGLDPELESLIGKLSSLEDKIAILNAAAVGVKITSEEITAIEQSDADPNDSTKLRAKERALKNINTRIKEQATLLEDISKLPPLTPDEELDAASASIEEQVIKLRDQAAAYDNLILSGIPAADAISLIGDESIVAAAKNGVLTEALRGQINEFLTLQKAAQARTGGGGSNPIQEAIKSLKEQRQQILNTSAAYGELRRSGMSATDAFRFAENSELISAMNAGLKVGSARWNEIIKLIKEAEAATKAWQNSTVQGKTEQFEDVYNRVIDLFDAEEAVLDAAFESATRSDNRLIDSLQEQIDKLNRQVENYSRDLDGIAEQEEVINKTYDEKVKALEETKRINEDILRQQKSQLSIADALSQGDIAAAASAIQESRAANAAAALGAQGNMLQLSREAELANVKSPGGLTRVQIEEKVKQLKKDIANIEFGALRDAQDRVAAAERELTAKREALTVAGTTRTVLEEQKAAIDLARARAEVYDWELQNALANVQGIVSGWKSLDTTITTNHVVNTINTGTGPTGPAVPATITTPPRSVNTRGFVPTRSGMVGRVGFMAKGGMVKPSFFSAGGFAKGTDTVPAMLTPGEYVVNRNATKKFGPLLSAINSNGRGFTTPVYPEISRTYPSANIGGGLYSNSNVSEMSAPIDNSVYNYNLSVNVAGTDATPDQIANVVMRKLQGVESQRVRGQVVR